MTESRDPFDDREEESGGPSRRGWIVLALLLGGILILVLALFSYNPGALHEDYSQARLVHLVALLALVGSGVLHARRYSWSTVAKQAGAWIAIALVLSVGYAFRGELQMVGDRLAGEIQPDRPIAGAAGTVTLRRADDRHFYIRAIVDGELVQFMVDTGASDVVLTPADARRLRFDLKALRFTQRYSTANGEVMGAPVRLGEVRVGPIVMHNVRASVNGADMSHSLLGMSFLNRLSGYEVAGPVLTLRR